MSPLSQGIQFTMTDGPPPEDHDYGDRRPDGQYENHPTTDSGEFVQRVRTSYTHDECGGTTTMGNALAESFARDPHQYGKTFCAECGDYFPLSEFVWKGTDKRLNKVHDDAPDPAPDPEPETDRQGGCCSRCGADTDGGLCQGCRDDAETTTDPVDTAFSTPDEVHAFVSGVYAGLKRPHRYPSLPDEWSSEAWYWKGGVLTAKAILVAAVVVTTYTQIGGF